MGKVCRNLPSSDLRSLLYATVNRQTDRGMKEISSSVGYWRNGIEI